MEMKIKMAWKRARKPEQKEQRRTVILNAAAQLFERHGLDKVSLNAIAKQSKISKSNIYRYFESKEVIFLHILYQDELEWAAALQRKLAPYENTDDIAAVAHILASTVAARPRLAALKASAASVLEKNVTEDSVLWFKTSMHNSMQGVAYAIHAVLPSLDLEYISLLLRYLFILIGGLWPIANPPPVVLKVLEKAELKYLNTDFSRDLEPALLFFLRGMKTSVSSKSF